MKSVTIIQVMLADKCIFVPSYQSSYSWDIDVKDTPPKQISTFFSDLKQYIDKQLFKRYLLGSDDISFIEKMIDI